ncbi:MAG: nitrous oxide reductase family maturation protein NosD [Bacteroidetes bacterium]|nr:nitrous oxide reductase family maturation protein NosD [Bacteroidota bacterium]
MKVNLRYLAGCMLLVLLSSWQSNARTLYVGKNHDIHEIKKAILLAQAGDSILVEKGVYKEGNIIVNKRLVLIGLQYPVLDGEGKTEIVTIQSDSCVIKGFKIQHSGYGTLEDPAGLKIMDANYVSILDNIVDDTFFGIYAQYAKHCIIKNNRLTSYGKEEQQIGNGIHCWKSDSLQIIGNTIRGHRDGIYFEFVTNSIIWLNYSEKNIRYGLHFMFSNSDAYIGNVFKNNGAGVAVMFTKDVKMFNNTFEQNWGDAAYGILLKEISDSYIEGNRFIENTSGIYMEGASRVNISKNVFQQNGWAVKIQASCMDVNLNHNNFFGNTFDVGTNGTLVLNNFNSNYWDKYEGYDIDRNRIGDIAYRPISMFSMIVEKIPSVMILFRSIMVTLLDKTEKLLPSITPENLKDDTPLMKPLQL